MSVFGAACTASTYLGTVVVAVVGAGRAGCTATSRTGVTYDHSDARPDTTARTASRRAARPPGLPADDRPSADDGTAPLCAQSTPGRTWLGHQPQTNRSGIEKPRPLCSP
ncbi:hypothetical protein ACIQF5_36015 [Streptomyces goshikiensis]|uniref:hypothetical protein n=1 Tax=Streptomyces goshikiensis TaxID=1942 RepID=UPI0037F51B58